MKKLYTSSQIVFALFVIVSVNMLLCGCSRQEPSAQQPKAKEPIVIKVGYQPIAANAPFYAGMESGLYEKAGLKVEPVSFNSSIDAIYALQRGEVAVLFAPPLNNIADALKKAPGSMKVFAIHGNDSTHYFEAFIVPTNSPIKALADFKGGTIGGYPGNFASIMATEIVKRKAGAVDVTFQTLDFGAQLGALAGGTVDLLFAYEPLPTIALSNGKARLLKGGPITDVFFSPFPISGVCISSKFVTQHPSEAALFVRTHRQVMGRMKEDPALVARAISVHANLDLPLAKKVNQCYFASVDAAQREAVTRVLNLFAELKIIDQVPPLGTFFYDAR